MYMGIVTIAMGGGGGGGSDDENGDCYCSNGLW